MSFGDVLDDAMDRALLDAFDAELDLTPVDMERRVVHRLARRQLRRRAQVGALVAIAVVAVIAVGVRGGVHTRAVQTEHPATHDVVNNGRRASSAAKPSRTPGRPDTGAAASGTNLATGAPVGGAPSGAGTVTGARPGTNGPVTGGPGSSAPNDVPSHELRVELRDSGLWVSTTQAIRPYDVTFADVRSVRPADVTLAVGGNSGSVATYGSPSVEEGPIGPTTLRVMHAFPHTLDPQDGVAPVTIDVVAPQLAAPKEPANVLTVDLHIGSWTLPFRELAADAPCVKGYGCGYSAWTSITPGTYTVVFRNPDHIGRKLLLPDGSTLTLARGDAQKTVTLTFANTPSRTYMLRAADDVFAQTEHLALWLS